MSPPPSLSRARSPRSLVTSEETLATQRRKRPEQLWTAFVSWRMWGSPQGFHHPRRNSQHDLDHLISLKGFFEGEVEVVQLGSPSSWPSWPVSWRMWVSPQGFHHPRRNSQHDLDHLISLKGFFEGEVEMVQLGSPSSWPR